VKLQKYPNKCSRK